MCARPPTSARIRHVDVEAVVAAYASTDTPVRAICEEHRIDWPTLYRILDDHHVPRREPDRPAPRTPQHIEEQTASAFHTGESVLSIADRLGVSRGTVSNVRRRHYGPLMLVRRHDELVELINHWLFEGGLTDSEADAIARRGVVVRLPGLRSLDHLHPELRPAVAERIAAELATRVSAERVAEALTPSHAGLRCPHDSEGCGRAAWPTPRGWFATEQLFGKVYRLSPNISWQCQTKW